MASLIDRYKELIQPASQKLSQALSNTAQKARSFNRAANTYNPIQRLGVEIARSAQSAGNSMAQRQDLINQRTKGTSLSQRVQRPRQEDERGLLSQGLQKSAETIGTILAPKYKAATAISGGLGYGATRLSGGSRQQALQSGIQSARSAPVFAGLASASNPYLAKLVPKSTGFLASRVSPAIANVAQGIGIDTATGQQTTPLSIGIDAVAGLAGGPGQFGNVSTKGYDEAIARGKALGINNVSPRVNKVHPEDLDVMREFADSVLRGGNEKRALGELGVSAQRLAAHYLGGDWKTASNKKLAQAFEWAIDLNMNIPREARGELPKLGIAGEDVGQSVISQMRNQPTKGVEVQKTPKYLQEHLSPEGYFTEGRFKSDAYPKNFIATTDIPETNIKAGDRVALIRGRNGRYEAVLDKPYQDGGFYVEREYNINPSLFQSSNELTKGVEAPRANILESQIDSPDTRNPLGAGMELASNIKTNQVETKLPETTPSKIDSFVTSVKEKSRELYTKTIDRFDPITQIGKQAGKQKEVRGALTGYYGAASTSDYHIDFELSPILKGADPADLRAAAIAQRDLELAGRDIKGSTSQKDAQKNLADLQKKLGTEGYAKLQVSLKQLYDYQDKLVQQYLVNTGVISKQAYDQMRANNQFYVPFKRVMETVDEQLGFVPQKQAGSVSSQNVIKGIKGSEKEVVDPLQSIIENTYKIVGLGKRQEVARTIVSLGKSLPEGVIYRAKGKVTGKNTISVFENGENVKYIVPKEVSDAAKGMTEDQMGTIIRILSAPTKVFRATATGLNPEFMLPNVARDLQSAFVNIGLNPLRFVQGLSSLMKKDQVYQDFLRSGGKVSSVSLDQPFVKKRLSEITGEKGLVETKPSKILSILQSIGEASEQPTRIAAFKQTRDKLLKQGVPLAEAERQAATAAQESTVNFARRGSETRTINAIYAFLNARVQGTDRLIRSIKADPKGAGVRMAMLTVAPAVGLYAHNRGFESYFDDRIVSERDKESNFIIMLSDEPVKSLGGAQFIKIPKGDIGKFANPVEQFLMYADNRGGDIKSSMLATLKSFIPMDNAGDLAPTAVRPILEDRANKNFFTGYDIVPSYKRNLPPSAQDSSYTAPLFRAIGDATNISPSRLQNMAEGYGTGFTKIAEMATKPLLPGYTSSQNMRGADINQTPVVRRFLGGEKKSESEYQEDSINKLEQLKRDQTMLMNKIRRGEVNEEDGNKQLEKIRSELELTSQKVTSQVEKKSKLVSQAGASDGMGLRKLSDVEKDDVKYAMKYGGSVDNDTLTSYYLGDAVDMPSSSRYEKSIRDKKLYSKISTIDNNENLSEDQKKYITDSIAKEIGIEPVNINYYRVANQDNDLKTIFMIEQAGKSRDPLSMIIRARREVNGQKIASDGVLDNLADEGVITEAQAKAIKKLKFDESGKPIVSEKKKSSGRKKSRKAPQAKVIKLGRPKTKRIQPRRIEERKIKKIKLSTLKAPKLKKLTLR